MCRTQSENQQARDVGDLGPHPLLELLSLVYLLNASADVSNEMVSVQHENLAFFPGTSSAKYRPTHQATPAMMWKDSKRLPLKSETRRKTWLRRGFKIVTFPKVPLYYLLWRGIKFNPRLSVLFDRSIEKHLTADAIWGLVNRSPTRC